MVWRPGGAGWGWGFQVHEALAKLMQFSVQPSSLVQVSGLWFLTKRASSLENMKLGCELQAGKHARTLMGTPMNEMRQWE